ncbi:YbhB/YbcL family Raf kinase inhibitor-like protein [Xanthomonas translucens]|uniref:YbhB/YbcL family Raf kinase inhibitor-like protein n=1 Tax=Xanthomonas campestris pv. translucens TaxID=343 RepID=UPI0002A78DE3|nr:YbhB/YbcL family Raf kinase inhibitor-like protein [Xanthomonas translucens]AKK66160.1 phosphatidylethanolamine-binding protein [Xanthomonas translucens pv. undulosa]AVY64987.1 phosphatidylethanolamine-binding protein [Xanthomonas translucens pv. undulosa]ELQ05986.1 phosphatidylethanolamine-binding protein [Xanthomonas translucens DAR61454]MBC3973053.1 YbhB/YbcL family Raf kinase inhibitor-like protein [Xanthomonas translucens pv. undulosa]MCT8270545.1 YbhB/YbcL family Raf kinase inhibitor-
MRLRSDSIQPGQPIAATYAMGQADGFAANRNPHLAWDDVPAGTAAFALLCLDPDVPTVAAMVGRDDVQIPVEQPRTNFVHWAAVEIPAGLREIAEGSASDGVVAKGKRQPPGLPGARQGLNSYTEWFAGDAQMGGDYYGYDGPYPPANDLRLHRYFFRLFALDVATLDLQARFTAADALRAMQGHVLAEASFHGTYSLNPKLA